MFKAIIFDFFDVIRTDAYKAWLSSNGYAREGQFAELSNQMDSGIITAEEFLFVTDPQMWYWKKWKPAQKLTSA